MRARVRKLREAIVDGKMAVCGESPRWIREELIVKLDQLLAISDDVVLASAVEAFSIGAIKFVADLCGSECEELVNSIAELRG